MLFAHVIHGEKRRMGVTDLGGKPGDDSAVILSSRMDPEFTRKTQNDPVCVQRQIGDGSHR